MAILNPTTPITGGDIVSSANALPVKIISGGGISTLTVNSTTITGGSTTRLMYDNGATLGETSGLTWSSALTTLSQTGNLVVGNGSNRSVLSSGGTVTQRFDDNTQSVPSVWQNYGISGTSQGIGFLFQMGSSSATGVNAATVNVQSTEDFSAAANRSVQYKISLIQDNAAATALTLTTTLLTLPGAASIATTLSYGGITFASTVTGSGSLVGATNPTLSSLIATGTLTYGGVTLASTVTGTGSMVLSTAPAITGAATFVSLSASGIGTFQNAVAASASAISTAILYSSTASFGIMWGAVGSVVPTVAATQGCIFINGSASAAANRMYIRSSASTWINFTMAS